MATFNIYNVLAASLAAFASKINLNTISQALRTFVPTNEMMPGRMNLFRFPDFSVLLDYAHNPHALQALGQMVTAFGATVKVGVITGVGDRRDEDLIAFAEEAARIFDKIIIRHDKDLRGRTAEQLNGLLYRGIHLVDPHKPVSFIPDECAAVDEVVRTAIAGSLVVILSDDIEEVYDRLNYHLDREKEKEAAPQV
ncbi:cyanophycin synthetase [Paraflavisolibacter sp. H34]|uniref:glutamate ligase domain-containing protein n=1 Tax=Huijunlia imazamoxiresistens TaxID=3127457 RepID=UPI00301B4528